MLCCLTRPTRHNDDAYDDDTDDAYHTCHVSHRLHGRTLPGPAESRAGRQGRGLGNGRVETGHGWAGSGLAGVCSVGGFCKWGIMRPGRSLGKPLSTALLSAHLSTLVPPKARHPNTLPMLQGFRGQFAKQLAVVLGKLTEMGESPGQGHVGNRSPLLRCSLPQL